LVLEVRERGVGERNDINTPAPNIYLSIRNLLLNEVYADVERGIPTMRELAERLREEMPIFDMNKREAYGEVAGADAGSHVLPLASKRYAVISALVHSIPSGRRFFLKPETVTASYAEGSERFNSVLNVRREAKLYETAYQYLRGDDTVDLLLIDGPLAFSNWWSMAGLEPDRQRLLDAVNRLLNLCMETDVPVAGVVKRPSARYLVYEMGIQKETDLPDAFIMLHTLKVGERTELFSPRSAIRKAVRASPFMDAVRCPIYSFYGRMSRDWAIPPVRIDVPAFALGHLEDIADHCYGSSFWGGIPLPIVRADECVKISKQFISGVYRDIVSRVGSQTGDVTYLAPYWGEGRWMGA